jgi:hypothetical protein
LDRFFINNGREDPAMPRKHDKNDWLEPKDKTQWLLDLIDMSEAAVKTYEKFLLDEVNHEKLSFVMQRLRKLLPMSIEDKYKNG